MRLIAVFVASPTTSASRPATSNAVRDQLGALFGVEWSPVRTVEGHLTTVGALLDRRGHRICSAAGCGWSSSRERRQASGTDGRSCRAPHHYAYYSADVAREVAMLVADGWSVEMATVDEQGRPTVFAYLVKPGTSASSWSTEACMPTMKQSSVSRCRPTSPGRPDLVECPVLVCAMSPPSAITTRPVPTVPGASAFTWTRRPPAEHGTWRVTEHDVSDAFRVEVRRSETRSTSAT